MRATQLLYGTNDYFGFVLEFQTSLKFPLRKLRQLGCKLGRAMKRISALKVGFETKMETELTNNLKEAPEHQAEL